ncbi:MAG: SPOR domain-containing protein [Gammaproteobacteria bacterium]
MRNIILPLLLANLIMLAWKQWIAPEDVVDPSRFRAADNSIQEPQLVLYGPARAQTETPAVVPAVASGADVRQCERIGPFSSPEPASSIARQLGGRGMTVDLVHETGDIWVGHWVQVADMETGAKAKQAVDRLVKAGLNDAYIVRTDPTVDISLGVFRGEAGATRVEKIARSAGLNPTRTDRFRTGTQHWVNVELLGAQSLVLTDLELPSSQILRTETIACRPTAETIADAADDSLESVAEAREPE